MQRLKERRKYRRDLRLLRIRQGLRASRRNRKLALALSAGTLALHGTALSAQYYDLSPQVKRIGPEDRRHSSFLSASDLLKRAIAQEEGLRLTVYRDVAGYPTVGVGHLVTAQDRLSVGDTITEARALSLLERDLRTAENGVRDLVGDLAINQFEFDALADLVFNVGRGNVDEDSSPRLNAAIRAGDHDAIAEELAYHNAGGEVAGGLVHRSDRRMAIFLAGDYRDPRPASRQT